MKRALLLLPLLLASVPLAATAPPAPPGDVLVLRVGGLDQLVVDAKDEGLRRALGLIDDRLFELALEFGPEQTASALAPLRPLLGRPLSLRVGMAEGPSPGGGPPFYAELAIEAGSVDAARAAARHIETLAAGMLGAEWRAAARPGFRALATPGGELELGVRGEGGSAALVARLGDAPAAGPALAHGLPEGIQPTLAFGLDLAPVSELIAPLLEGLGPKADQLGFVLDLFGLSDGEPVGFVAGMGHCSEHLHASVRVTNGRAMAERAGSLVEAPLDARHYALVPPDATTLVLSRSDPTAVLQMLRRMPQGEMAIDTLLAEIEEQTGVHLENDLLGYLGDTLGYYASDSTGGGGLLSFVVFVEVADAAGLAGSLAQLEELVNGMGAALAQGYVRVRSFQHAGDELRTLVFPGLPVPLELSYALSGGWLVAAATPQGLVAALHQLKTVDAPDIRSNPHFQVATAGRLDGALSVQFQDVPRLLRDGYGAASLAFSALANAVRSPHDPAREPGMVLPPLAELRRDALASATLTRLDGDDLVSELFADRSVCVNATGMLGSPGMALVPLVLLGAGLAGYSQSAQSAPFDFEQDDEFVLDDPDVAREWILEELVSLRLSLDSWAQWHAGDYPSSLDVMLEPDEDGFAFLDELPVDPWDVPYYYQAPGPGQQLLLYSLGQDGMEGGEGLDADVELDEPGFRRHDAINDMHEIQWALGQYAEANGGRYPDSLVELITPDESGESFLFYEDVPQDPWGRPFVYAPPAAGDALRLCTLGRDGALGGEGEDEDLYLSED